MKKKVGHPVLRLGKKKSWKTGAKNLKQVEASFNLFSSTVRFTLRRRWKSRNNLKQVGIYLFIFFLQKMLRSLSPNYIVRFLGQEMGKIIMYVR